MTAADDGEVVMAMKWLVLGAVALAGALVVGRDLPSLKRYLKIEKM